MKKINYQRPEMTIVTFQPQQIICLSKGALELHNESELDYGLDWQPGGLNEFDL